MPSTAANSLISVRLPELTAVAKGQANSAPHHATVSLTCGLASGDEEAFRQFQTLYFDRLYRFLLVVTRGHETQAREALQETLLRVARHARRFEDEDAFWCWLAAIARNAARDAGRSQSRYLALLERFTQAAQPEAPSPGHDDTLSVALEKCVGEMEPDDRLLIEGKYLDGQSVRELASQAGLSEKAVESRLLRLRRQLRDDILKKLKTP